MAAVATAPPPPSLAGPSVPRPASAASGTSQTKRSTSVSSKRGSEPPTGAPPALAITVEEVKEEAKEGSKSPAPAPTDVPAPAPAAADPAGSPSKTTRPPIRPIPAVRSKFDLEPNPFEQSFRESHRSDSLDDVNEAAGGGRTPPRGGDATAIKHNALPPLSSLTSPAAADPSQFPWLANQSLRAGPLSPAMLGGPTGHSGNGSSKLGPGNGHGHTGGDGNGNGNGNSGGGDEGGFDQSNFRTGFTPGTGSGFTPGFTSFMGGANFSNLPLPSPNTAAFLNMVTNATPTEGESSQQPTGTNGSHGPSALPPHMQHHGLSHISNHDMQQDTITPNTLSALTGVVNDMNRQQAQQQQQQQQHGQHPGNSHLHGQHGPHPPHGAQHPSYYNQHLPPPGYALPPGMPHVDYAQQSANAASQAANGLFLLSQAHQELSKREEEGRGPNSGPPGAGQGQGHGGSQMNIPGMGGMAPGAAHAHGHPGQPGHLGGHPQHPSMMGYPGHPGMPNHGMPGSGMPPTLNHPHSHLGGSISGAPQGVIPPTQGQNNQHGMPGNVKRDSGSLKGSNADPTGAAPQGQKRKSDAADLGTSTGAPGGKGKKGKKGAAAAAGSGTSPPNTTTAGGKKAKNGTSAAAAAGIKGESTSPAAGDMSMSFNSMGRMGMGMGMLDDEDDEDGSEHDGISKITGKPETEEEKRKNFLERNRQAALKCRQRKKQWLNELQTKVEQLQMDNDRLNQTVAGLHDEIGRLSGVLMQHRDCGLGLPTGYGRPIR